MYDGNQIVLQFDSSSPLPSGEGQGEGTSGEGDGTSASANSQGVQLTAADLSHRYLWGPAVDQLLSDEQVTSVSQPGTVVLPLTDNLGTVRDLAICDLTTGTTSVVNHLEYNSFGVLLSQTNPATGNAAAVDCLFGLTGRAFDTNAGLQNNTNRWYDASFGRWISLDPSGFAAGDTNLYRYVGNSPANATDPSGLASVTWAPPLPVWGVSVGTPWEYAPPAPAPAPAPTPVPPAPVPPAPCQPTKKECDAALAQIDETLSAMLAVTNGQDHTLHEATAAAKAWATVSNYRSDELKKQPAFFQQAVADIEGSRVLLTASGCIWVGEWIDNWFIDPKWNNGNGDAWMRMEILRELWLKKRIQALSEGAK